MPEVVQDPKNKSDSIMSAKYCRLCAKLCSSTVHIFEEMGEFLLLYLKILHHLTIPVSVNDPLTKHICMDCVKKLDFVEKFRNECLGAQICLRRKLYDNSFGSGNRENVSEGNIRSSQNCERMNDTDNEICTSVSNCAVNGNEASESQSPLLNSEKPSGTAGKLFFNCNENELDVEMEVVEEEDYYDINDDNDDNSNSLERSEIHKEETDIKKVVGNFSDKSMSNFSKNLESNKKNDETHINVSNVNRITKFDSGNEKETVLEVKDKITSSYSNRNNNSEKVECDNTKKQIGKEVSAPIVDLSACSEDDDNANDVDISSVIESDDNRMGISESVSNEIEPSVTIPDDDDDHHVDDEVDDDVSNVDESNAIDDSQSNPSNSRELAENVDSSDEESKIEPKFSELYLRKEDKESNDNLHKNLTFLNCLQSLYEGTCSIMPYFIRWQLPDGEYRVGFKCYKCLRFYFTLTDIVDHLFEHLCCVCDLCNEVFRVKYNYMRHLSNKHFFDMKKGLVKCNFCGEELKDSTKVIRHKMKHCIYRCGMCSFKTTCRIELNCHKKNHVIKEEDCKDCLSFFCDDTTKLIAHVLKVTKKTGFICKSCGMGFHVRDHLKLHYQIYGSSHSNPTEDGSATQIAGSSNLDTSNPSKPNNKPNQINDLSYQQIFQLFHDILDKKISFSHLPKSTFGVHGKGTVQGYKCPVCHKKMPESEKCMNIHIKNHLLYVCKRCRIVCRNPSVFSEHMSMRVACKISVYKCSFCENTLFDKLSEYMTHARLHLLKKICDYCSESFPCNRKKYLHIVKMHKDKLKSYFCDQCGAEFVQNCILKTHYLQVHGGGTRKVCKDCGVFISKHKHNCSNRNETDEEFICAYCSKVFKSKCALEYHILVHMDLKSYECKFCDKSFNRITSLQKHKKDMHSERKWRCMFNNCDKSYSYKSALECHMKTRHNPQSL